MATNDDIVAKLDTLIRLTAVEICGDKVQKEKIEILGSAGLTPKEIADIVGTTSNTVSVALARSKKKKTGKKKKDTGKEA